MIVAAENGVVDTSIDGFKSTFHQKHSEGQTESTRNRSARAHAEQTQCCLHIIDITKGNKWAIEGGALAYYTFLCTMHV